MQLALVVGAPPSDSTWCTSRETRASRSGPWFTLGSAGSCSQQCRWSGREKAIRRGRPYCDPSAVHAAEEPNQLHWIPHASSSLQASSCPGSQHSVTFAFSRFPTLEFCLVECNWFLFSISGTGQIHMFFPIQAKDQEDQRYSSHPKDRKLAQKNQCFWRSPKTKNKFVNVPAWRSPAVRLSTYLSPFQCSSHDSINLMASTHIREGDLIYLLY